MIMGKFIFTMFTVEGPFDLVPTMRNRVKQITQENIENFWKEHHHFAGKAGCYIFALRAGKGFTPWYVGKTKRRFDQEAFQPRNVQMYNELLFEGLKGSPVIFFVALPLKKGPNNNKAISELEAMLIQQGVMANPDLLNTHGTKPQQWGIKGVFMGGSGKPTAEAKSLRTMLHM